MRGNENDPPDDDQPCDPGVSLGKQRTMQRSHAAGPETSARAEDGPERGRRERGRLGAFELLRPLGAGGMGEVYEAIDMRNGHRVALKMLFEVDAVMALG